MPSVHIALHKNAQMECYLNIETGIEAMTLIDSKSGNNSRILGITSVNENRDHE